MILWSAAWAGTVGLIEVGPDGTRTVVRAIQIGGTPPVSAPLDPRWRSFDGTAIQRERAWIRAVIHDVPAERPRMEALAERFHGDSPPSERMDVLVLGEGYQASEAGRFRAHTEALRTELLNTAPFDRYRDLLNLWRMPLASLESGVSKDTRFEETSVDTALSCTLGCNGAHRIYCCDDLTVLESAELHLPEADAIFVLVNDEEFGGAGSFSYAVSYTGEGWLPVAVHELGHVMGNLYDEYDYGFELGGHAANCAPVPAFVPWRDWIGTDGVNAFPTCAYRNLYRPTESGCRMRELDGAFCPVCREALVKQLFSHVPLLTGPEEPDAQVTVQTQAGARVSWTVDGREFATGPTAELPACGLVMATATHETEWVRHDPEGALTRSLSWDLGACPTSCSSAPLPSSRLSRRR